MPQSEQGLSPEGGEPIPALVLFGPTASGKTEILEALFSGEGGKSRFCPAEVVSADSMQVYRGMDIGTAKPGPEEMRRLPHHLIGILSPREQFNAGDFVRLAEASCLDIARRGLLPVVSGGTGFYIRNLLSGLPEAPPSDKALREKMKEELARLGPGPLREELALKDPVSAERIHLHDTYRLLRALEVIRVTGKPLSAFVRERKGESPFRYLVLGLRREREELYRRIDRRCAEMFRAGLPEEVRGLFLQGFSPLDPGLKAIGYREFFAEDGSGGFAFREDFPAVEALVARNSRRYAKRQITYFASLPQVTWIDAGKDAPSLIRRELEAFLKGNRLPTARCKD